VLHPMLLGWIDTRTGLRGVVVEPAEHDRGNNDRYTPLWNDADTDNQVFAHEFQLDGRQGTLSGRE
jgi:hypothetical protein